MILRRLITSSRTFYTCPRRLCSIKVMPVNTYYRFKKKDREGIQPQRFKYFLVLDFEATCDREYFPEMEIIEFPCLKVCGSSFVTLDIFHEYVRPIKHPVLTEFCKKLTGIDQDLVTNAAPFPEVLEKFLQWLRTNHFQLDGSNVDTIFVTSGDWDLNTMLLNQCKLSGVPIPENMTSWINVKKAFLASTGVFPRGIKDMLRRLDLKHEGRLHSGIDDCKNIAKIMEGLAQRGFIFEKTRNLDTSAYK